MRYVAPERWRLALSAYIVGGVATGFLTTPLEMLAQYQFGARQLGVVIAVNLVLPAVAIAVSVWYPRLRTAAIGGGLVCGSFFIARMFEGNPWFWTWTPSAMLSHLHPVLIGAAVGCTVLSLVAAMIATAFRRVGLVDQHLRCSACGYLLTGACGNRCPECGAGR